ncbi:MAG: CBS domain-containing protein [Xenococcaceae cyanobacterium MO_207.B15]|nr:CBS domain-containing protein [Xenococcaceae cyanobacterium MO_207.B15]
MKVADIMSKKVITIRGFATVAHAVKLMREHGLSSLIVDRLDESDSYGIVTKTDIIYKVAAKGFDPNEVRVCQIMTKPCIVVNPDLSTKSVAQLFANTGIRRAPIIREKLVGIVSLTDLLLRSNFLEQPGTVLLGKQIEQKIADARKICAEKGFVSEECAAAWDVVEDLQAEEARQQAEDLKKTAFDEYCQENPEAKDIRRYDPWFCHWEKE